MMILMITMGRNDMENMTVAEMGYVEEIRQRLGLERDDTSRDGEIERMSPIQRAGLVVGWFHGSESWARQYKEYFESQGIYLTTNADDPEVIR
jgi:hypothetical protein